MGEGVAMRIIASVALVGLFITQQPTQQPPAGAGQGQGAGPGQGAGQGQGQGRGRGGGRPQPDPIDFDEHDGWTSLFDGKSLNGWSGDNNWKVEDGAITIEPTCEKPTGTVYLVWQGGDASDFELKLRMKGTGDINGGVQYRGWIGPHAQRGGAPGARGAGGAPGAAAPGAAAPGAAAPGTAAPGAAPGAPGASGAPGAGGPPPGGGRGPQGPCPSGAPRGTPPNPATEDQWNMFGAQYDFDAANHYTGQFYEQGTRRGIVAWKGQVVRTEEGKSPRLLATLGDQASIDAIYKPNEWNELHIIAVGTHMTHLLNGRVISILVDEDASRFHGNGKIGIEVEATGKLFTKDIWLKKLAR
jgi:hypothetical protein